MALPPLSPDELRQWAQMVQQTSGIQLDATKGYLIETRLASLLQETGAQSWRDLLMKVTGDASGGLRRKVLNAITTNETSFFRDTSPFDLLRFKLIPELIDRRRQVGQTRLTLRIWSAACSTGQEAYSIGILLRELLGDLTQHDIRILGTDISERAVAAASYAHYSAMELERGMPRDSLARHFTNVNGTWKVRDEVRALATFRVMNLLDPSGLPGNFDIVFCRNVAIYFSEADRQRLYRGIGRMMARDGALIIGSTETMTGLCPEFESQRYLRTVYYRLR